MTPRTPGQTSRLSTAGARIKWRVAVIAKLCQMGYAERMVLSHDAMVYFDWYEPEVAKAFGPNWNYFHIVDNVIPALLEAGVSQQQIDIMTRENPRRIFESVGTY